ncbi:MAG: efflux transporter outer membrane subunit [Sulfuricellaceae bacterium]|nr:efflux transporter outer membrane subunit [Sulfuricellaceae bacterium]
MMQRNPVWLCAALCLANAGCQTLPPPSRAEIQQQGLTNVALPTEWKADSHAGVIADNWLASFNDVELDALVSEAIAHNPDLRVGATRVEQAGQYVELAKAALRPAVNLFGSGGVNMGGGDALKILSLAVSWEPDLWGRMRYGRDAAQETYASALADFEFSRQSIAAATAKSWFTASETGLQQEISDEMVKSAQQLLTLAEKRQQVGAGNEQDTVLARANLGNIQDSAAQIRLAHQQSLRALEILLGRYPSAELQARKRLASLPAPVPVGMPLETLERRPDLIAAERRVAAAFNRVGEAKAARLPSLVLNANVAGLSSEILQLQEDFSNPTGGIGAKFLAPIYQGGALNTQVEIRTLEQKEALAQYARMALRAINDVESALAAGKTLADRANFLQRVLADNQRALELAQTSYRVGKTDFRAVQQQFLSLYAARLALLRVQSEQLAQRTNLHLALGGSFETRRTKEGS